MSGSYLLDTGIQILVMVCLASSLNVLMGFAGQFSMATAAFYAVGAYTYGSLTATGITMMQTPAVGPGWPFVVGLVLATMAAGVVGIVVAAPAARRVKGEYIIILTLAFHYLVQNVVTAMDRVTGGTRGMTVPPISFGEFKLETPLKGGLFILLITIIIVALTWMLGRWGFGRLLRGIREDEEALQSLGKATVSKKTIAFGVSAAMAGAMGALGGAYLMFVAPQTYSFDLVVLISAAIALGGSGNVWGGIIGAVVIASVGPILTNLGMTTTRTVPWQYVILGALLYLVVRFRQQGIMEERPSRPRLLMQEARRLKRASRASMVTGSVASAALGGSVPGVGLTGDFGTSKNVEVARSDSQRAGIAEGSAVPTGSRGGSARNTGFASGDVETVSDVGAAPSCPRSEITSGRGEVKVRVAGLSKRFGGLVAVDDVNLELRAGEIVALVGPNGAGKTTLFNLFTNVITPDAGVVELRGVDVRKMRASAIAKSGMVRSWQHVRVFPNMSVLDNVAVAVPNQLSESLLRLATSPRASMRREAEVLRIALDHLEFVGMREHAFTMARNLSFGQQKAVAIARVLATGSEVLLLDEPTSGVDPKSAEEAINLVKRLARAGKCVCIVEHSLHVVEALADRVVFLDSGRVIAEGSVSEITSRPELHELYFGRTNGERKKV